MLINHFKKYNLSEEENGDMIDVIEFYLTQLIPKFYMCFNEKELRFLFDIALDLIEVKSSQLRFSAKFLIKGFLVNNKIKFV